MTRTPATRVAPITRDDLPAVGRFLHENLNSRLSAALWANVIGQHWGSEPPNHGFLLRANGLVVGVYAALYSQRNVGGVVESICNLAAWCVLEPYRSDGLRLIRAMLKQPDYSFTDLSPSGNVIELNTRLGFATLDPTTYLVPILPWFQLRHRVQLSTDPKVIEASLTGRERMTYEDHRNSVAARHVLLQDRDGKCYVVFRTVRRKGLPIFAFVLYVSDPATFRRCFRIFLRHCVRSGQVFALFEMRIVQFHPMPSWRLKNPRIKMFRSASMNADQIDYLYSELSHVPW